MHSSNPSAPRQPECVVGIIKSLEARGSRHPHISGTACWLETQPPSPSQSICQSIQNASKIQIGYLQVFFWKTCFQVEEKPRFTSFVLKKNRKCIQFQFEMQRKVLTNQAALKKQLPSWDCTEWVGTCLCSNSSKQMLEEEYRGMIGS